MNLSLCSLSFLGLACRSTSCLAPAMRLIQLLCESVHFAELAENTSRRKGKLHSVGFSSWISSTKAQQKQRRGQDLVLVCDTVNCEIAALSSKKKKFSPSD